MRSVNVEQDPTATFSMRDVTRSVGTPGREVQHGFVIAVG
jgi:hypothetical protein